MIYFEIAIKLRRNKGGKYKKIRKLKIFEISLKSGFKRIFEDKWLRMLGSNQRPSD